MKNIHKPEKNWRPAVKKFWRDSLDAFDYTPDGLEILRVACNSLERYYQAKDILDTEGLTFRTASGIRKHPAAEIEKTARQGFLQACRQLGVATDADTEKRNVGRPWGQEGI